MAADANGERGLTGVWQGLYSYARGEAVSFTAVLIEIGSHLSGSTHEPCTMPGCPIAAHEAFLSGSRHGKTVTFTKTYEPPGYGYEVVRYEGTLSIDSTEVDGQWTIPMLTGRFLMIRTPGAERQMSEKKHERV